MTSQRLFLFSVAVHAALGQAVGDCIGTWTCVTVRSIRSPSARATSVEGFGITAGTGTGTIPCPPQEMGTPPPRCSVIYLSERPAMHLLQDAGGSLNSADTRQQTAQPMPVEVRAGAWAADPLLKAASSASRCTGVLAWAAARGAGVGCIAAFHCCWPPLSIQAAGPAYGGPQRHQQGAGLTPICHWRLPLQPPHANPPGQPARKDAFSARLISFI